MPDPQQDVRSVRLKTCDCGAVWAGGNSKYCPEGHADRFIEESVIPQPDHDRKMRELDAKVQDLQTERDKALEMFVGEQMRADGLGEQAAALERLSDYAAENFGFEETDYPQDTIGRVLGAHKRLMEFLRGDGAVEVMARTLLVSRYGERVGGRMADARSADLKDAMTDQRAARDALFSALDTQDLAAREPMVPLREVVEVLRERARKASSPSGSLVAITYKIAAVTIEQHFRAAHREGGDVG